MRHTLQNSLKQRQVLSNEAVVALAPSIAASSRCEATTSERFGAVPTLAVIDSLRSAGWTPMAARQQRIRDELSPRNGFQLHQVKFHNPALTQNAGLAVGDSVFELSMRNAFDGRGGAYSLEAGLFRLTCLNGMMVSEGLIASARFSHMGLAPEQVLEASLDMARRIPEIGNAVREWRSHKLSAEQQMGFAQAAWELRWDDEKAAPCRADMLLQPRRYADGGDDLWHVFNRVQENLLFGTVVARRDRPRWTAEGQRIRQVKARPVSAITEDRRINKSLWGMAEAMHAGRPLATVPEVSLAN